MSPEDIHHFWFAEALSAPATAGQRMAFWFKASRETDQLIAQRFAQILEEAGRGLLDDWEAQPRACLALVIVLDQFPRNMHRSRAKAFEHDTQALAVTKRGIAAGYLPTLHTLEQAFFLMPFQHCENLGCQREGVTRFEQLVEQAPEAWRDLAEGMLRSARLHLEIIERFARFPHRNRIVGRVSTAAEEAYLESDGVSFGQRA